jgi:glycosyltransferase 2 family protein
VSKRSLAVSLLGLLISGICLWYTFKGVDLSALLKGMSRVGVGWVMASVLAGLFSLVIRAIRWRVLLASVRSVDTGALVSATFVGMMANNLLPARLGEFVRAWVLARREQIPVPTVLATIVIERLMDVFAALMILGLCLASLPGLGSAAGLFKQVGFGVLAVASAGLGVLFILVRYPHPILASAERWSRHLSPRWTVRALDPLRAFLEGLWVFRSGARLAGAAGLSLVIWALAIGSFHVLAEGFRLGLTPLQTALVFVIVLFGVALPSAPGFVGTFHGFCVAGLAMVAGIEATQAAAYATLLHGSQWMAVNVVGLGYLVGDRSLSWSAMVGFARHGTRIRPQVDHPADDHGGR